MGDGAGWAWDADYMLGRCNYTLRENRRPETPFLSLCSILRSFHALKLHLSRLLNAVQGPIEYPL